MSPLSISLDQDRFAILSDLAAKQHQKIDDMVNTLLCEILDDYQEIKELKALIQERDKANAEFEPYDPTIWD